MILISILIISLLSYLIGNFSGSIIVGKLFLGKDIRKLGSGNAGTTNALRSFGLKAGLGTLIIDMAKGILAVWIASKFGYIEMIAAGLFVVVGHNWPALFGFKGGKGIATSAGVLLYIQPLLVGILLIIFFVVVGTTRYVSLSSIIGAISAPIIAFILDYNERPEVVYLILVLSLIALYRHRENIQRLRQKKENKFVWKRSS